jgi:hypothetical protein
MCIGLRHDGLEARQSGHRGRPSSITRDSVVTSATPWRGGIDTRRACAVNAHQALMRDLEVRADQSFNRRSVVSGQFKFCAIS